MKNNTIRKYTKEEFMKTLNRGYDIVGFLLDYEVSDEDQEEVCPFLSDQDVYPFYSSLDEEICVFDDTIKDFTMEEIYKYTEEQFEQEPIEFIHKFYIYINERLYPRYKKVVTKTTEEGYYKYIEYVLKLED